METLHKIQKYVLTLNISEAFFTKTKQGDLVHICMLWYTMIKTSTQVAICMMENFKRFGIY